MIATGMFFMAEAKRTRAGQKHVDECVPENRCLFVGCEKPIECCGRCTEHYNNYYNLARNMTRKEATDFFMALWVEGTILKPQEIRMAKRNDADSLAARRIG